MKFFIVLFLAALAHSAWAAEPLPGKQVIERVDRLMRSLPRLSGEARKQAISDLYDIEKSKEPGEADAVLYFGYDVTQNVDGTRTLTPKPDRNEVLSKAIPALISAIDDAEGVNNKAWWILIFLQTDCPPPQRAVWEAWWKKAGPTLFATKPDR
ncbi:hypothetical protein [Prosthecobacter sp.]|uniref:hypothetical protein n=1 Tax=Prosthecobacter sp. TaxID=1965333 RepID=UPI0037838DFF